MLTKRPALIKVHCFQSDLHTETTAEPVRIPKSPVFQTKLFRGLNQTRQTNRRECRQYDKVRNLWPFRAGTVSTLYHIQAQRYSNRFQLVFRYSLPPVTPKRLKTS